MDPDELIYCLAKSLTINYLKAVLNSFIFEFLFASDYEAESVLDTICDPPQPHTCSSEDANVSVELCDQHLWSSFAEAQTEMIVTKIGR